MGRKEESRAVCNLPRCVAGPGDPGRHTQPAVDVEAQLGNAKYVHKTRYVPCENITCIPPYGVSLYRTSKSFEIFFNKFIDVEDDIFYSHANVQHETHSYLEDMEKRKLHE